MISHTHRCIFVHIPRTAGSSIEEWIVGRDWWDIDAKSKHISAHQAKQLYAEYWDEYFTFSFVRNPWDRMASCARLGRYFGVDVIEGGLDFSGYESRFGYPVTLEVDHRFHDPRELRRPDVHLPGAVYGNLLDEELDFVGRFEDLQADTAQIAESIGLRRRFNSWLSKGPSVRGPQTPYDSRTAVWVSTAFARDIATYGYEDDARFRDGG